MADIQILPLDAINATGGTQSRAGLNEATVSEYAEALSQDAKFPPVIVFGDGSSNGNWLADGFHRFHAHRAAGLTEIVCDVRVGTLRDAKLFAAGANGTHGLRRTNADKRQSVVMVLSDAEWQSKPETWVADACKVSRTLVRSVLDELHLVQKHDAVRTVERNGKSYEMNTAKIGKTSESVPAVHLAQESADAPDFGATFSSPVTVPAQTDDAAVSLDDLDDQDDADTPDLVELLAAEQATVEQLRAEVATLKARVQLLERGDLAAQIVALEHDRDGIRNRAATHYESWTKANNKVIEYKKLLDKLRKIAGVEKYGDLAGCIVPAARG